MSWLSSIFDAVTSPVASLASAAIGGLSSVVGGSMRNSAEQDLASDQAAVSMASQANQFAHNWEMYRTQRDDNYLQWLRETAVNRDNATTAYDRQLALQLRNEAFSAQQVAEAREYNSYMSNSAWQRGVADMRAAGLNPVLGVSQGGASTPFSPVGTPVSPGTPMAQGASTRYGGSSSAGSVSFDRARYSDFIGPAVSNALQAARVTSELESIAANTARTRAETEVSYARAGNVRANTALTVAQAESEGFRPAEIRARTESEHRRPGAIGAAAEASIASAEAARQRAALDELEVRRFRDYGPRGAVPDALASGEAIGRRIGAAAGGGSAPSGRSPEHEAEVQRAIENARAMRRARENMR